MTTARAHEGTIVHRNANADVPDALWKAIIEKYPTYSGCAVPSDGNIIEVSLQAGGLTVEAIQEMVKQYQDKPMQFHFGSGPDNVSEDSVQPFNAIEALFTVANPDSTQGEQMFPVVTVMMDGAYERYSEPGSVHSPSFFAFNKHLRPLLHKIWDEILDEDPEKMSKFLEAVKSPLTQFAITGMSTGDGTVSIMPASGSPLSLTTGRPRVEYPWGYTTFAGYSEEPAKTVTGQVGRIVGQIGRIIKPAAAPAAAPAAKPDELVILDGKTKQTTQTAVPPNSGIKKNKKFRGDKNLSGTKLKDQYIDEAGFCPPDFHKRPEVDIMDGFTPKSQRDKTVAQPTVDKSVVTAVVPIMGPKVLEAILDEFVKKIKSDPNMLVTDGELNKLEKTYPTFTQAIGLKEGLDDLTNLSYEALIMLAQKYPDGTALLNFEYALDRRKLKARLAKLEEENAAQLADIERLTNPQLPIGLQKPAAAPVAAAAPTPAAAPAFGRIIKRA